MHYCTKCGAQLPVYKMVCPECKEEIMFLPNGKPKLTIENRRADSFGYYFAYFMFGYLSLLLSMIGFLFKVFRMPSLTILGSVVGVFAIIFSSIAIIMILVSLYKDRTYTINKVGPVLTVLPMWLIYASMGFFIGVISFFV